MSSLFVDISSFFLFACWFSTPLSFYMVFSKKFLRKEQPYKIVVAFYGILLCSSLCFFLYEVSQSLYKGNIISTTISLMSIPIFLFMALSQKYRAMRTFFRFLICIIFIFSFWLFSFVAIIEIID